VRIEPVRLLVLKTAWLMDTVGNKGAHTEIQAIKIATPAMPNGSSTGHPGHGAGGVSQDFRWLSCGPARGLSGSPTGPTKSTSAHSRDAS